MKITAKWNSGNFSFEHVANVPDTAIESLLRDAIVHNCQRMGEIDVILGIITTGKDGKKVRSKTLKRGDVPYDDDKAQAFSDLFGSLTVKNGEKEIEVPMMTGVERYDREAASVYKFSEERKIASAIESESDAEALPKLTRIWAAVGKPAATPTHGEDGEFSPEYLAAIRARRAQVGV